MQHFLQIRQLVVEVNSHLHLSLSLLTVMNLMFAAWKRGRKKTVYDTILHWSRKRFWLRRGAVCSQGSWCVDFCLSLVLWHCWLGGRKGIRPVKIWSDEVLAWLSVWSKVQIICIWFSWCHCHPIISCFSKIQNGLSFWYRPTQVVLEKRPLNVCVCVRVCAYAWSSLKNL